jgi:glycosyltransferase involved in cell wall biosynthesis
MRICHIISTQFPPEEGIGNYVHNLSKKLIDSGHSVSVITRSPSLRSESFKIDGIGVHWVTFVPIYPIYMNLHGFFLNKLIKKLESEFDIVHMHTPLVPLIKTSLPVVVTVHTPMLSDTRSIIEYSPRAIGNKLMGRFVSYPIELKLLKRADLITVVSNSVALELNEYGLCLNEIAVVGNGVDEKIFRPGKKKTSERYILYVGRLDYRKGLFDLVDCAKTICSQYKNIHFKIVGKGILEQRLKRKISEYKLENNFEFVGYVTRPRLISLYQNAVLFIVPSHYEGLPTVLLEAMSCGLPVIATAVSGNLDVIDSGKNGLLIPSKSPKEMADAVSLLLNDDNMRINLGRNARKTIEGFFNWDIISQKITKYYESICWDIL